MAFCWTIRSRIAVWSLIIVRHAAAISPSELSWVKSLQQALICSIVLTRFLHSSNKISFPLCESLEIQLTACSENTVGGLCYRVFYLPCTACMQRLTSRLHKSMPSRLNYHCVHPNLLAAVLVTSHMLKPHPRSISPLRIEILTRQGESSYSWIVSVSVRQSAMDG